MFYLKEQAYFEPLFNQWYAWSYLIPPVTAARFVENTHRRVMVSFIKNYELHILANQEKVLTGGEFLNCSADQLSAIEALVAKIDNEQEDILALSGAVKALDELLRNHTSGETIEHLYEQIPAPLKGYVELFLDLEHKPAYRLIEGLLYSSEHYRCDLQSISFGLLSKVEQRPFVFSTPRLPDENHLQLSMPFNHSDFDRLMASREIPLDKAAIDAIFAPFDRVGGLNPDELFTEEKPSKVYQPVEKGLRINYTGHAGFLLETADVSIMVDPVIAAKGGPEPGVMSFAELPPKIDYICITHNHQDHVNLETLLQLRYKVSKVLVPKNNGSSLADPSLRKLLMTLKFDVIEVDDMDQLPLPGGRIVSLPFLGEHGDLNVRSKTAWFIELCNKKMFLGADSSNLDPTMYKHIERVLGKVDILALGMECIGAPYTWLYGALHSKPVSKAIKQSRRLNGADSAQAIHMVETFNPDEVYIYALGMEPCYKYFMGIEYDDDSKQIQESDKLIKAAADINIPAQRLFGRKTLNYE